MRCLPGAAAAAIVLVCVGAPAEARTPVYARVKCVGGYCQIVTEPDPAPEPVPADWRKGLRPAARDLRQDREQRYREIADRIIACAKPGARCDAKHRARRRR